MAGGTVGERVVGSCRSCEHHDVSVHQHPCRACTVAGHGPHNLFSPVDGYVEPEDEGVIVVYDRDPRTGKLTYCKKS
jgi:hypothetical protein